MTPPQLQIDRLRPGSRCHYERVFRWLCEHVPGPWERTEPFQRFLDEHPDERVRHGVRGRIVQSIINRHVRPRPEGPPLVLRPVRSAKRPSPKKTRDDPATAWVSYLPVWMTTELDRCPEVWRQWLAHYVVRVLRANALRRNIIRTYVTHAYNVLFRHMECRSLDDFLSLRREELAQAVVDVNAVRVHQQRLCRIAVNHFIAGSVFRDHHALVERLHLRTRDLPHAGLPVDGATCPQPYDNVDVVPRTRARDHFTEAEMQALLSLPHLTPRDRLMLCIMAETGLRRRAVSWLLVDAVYDRAGGEPRAVGAATEKGLVVRRFQLSARTQGLLTDYIRNHHPGASTRWLFPSPQHGARAPVSPGVVGQVLARACEAAGIRGRHVHTHAIRKGVVCRLMQANNRIENVAKWLGHKTVNLTYATYWDVDGLDVAHGMNIPWLEESATDR